jgi:hypothetical protein
MTPDLKAIVARSRGIAHRMNGGVGFLIKKNKVDIIWGEAKITKPGEMSFRQDPPRSVEPQGALPKSVLPEGTYTAKHIIVATGARPRALPGIEPDGKLIWTYFEAMKPEEMPKSLLVMGSGAIGIEFASLLPHHRRRRHRRRDDEARSCRWKTRRSRTGQEAVREAGHEDPAGGQGRQGREGRQVHHRHHVEIEGRQDREDHG